MLTPPLRSALPQVFRPEDEVRGLVPSSYVELMG
jgi:hypothetical protein